MAMYSSLQKKLATLPDATRCALPIVILEIGALHVVNDDFALMSAFVSRTSGNECHAFQLLHTF